MPLPHIGPSKPVEPHCQAMGTHSLPGDQAQVKDKESSVVAATGPALSLMGPDETAFPTFPVPSPHSRLWRRDSLGDR